MGHGRRVVTTNRPAALVPTSAARHRHFRKALNAGFEHRPGLCAVAVDLHRRSYPVLVVKRSDRDHHCLWHQLDLDRDGRAAFRAEAPVGRLAAVAAALISLGYDWDAPAGTTATSIVKASKAIKPRHFCGGLDLFEGDADLLGPDVDSRLPFPNWVDRQPTRLLPNENVDPIWPQPQCVSLAYRDKTTHLHPLQTPAVRTAARALRVRPLARATAARYQSPPCRHRGCRTQSTPPFLTIGHERRGAVLLRHLTRIGLDLMPPGLAADEEPESGTGGVAQCQFERNRPFEGRVRGYSAPAASRRRAGVATRGKPRWSRNVRPS